jgi:hypothetical protein
MLITGQSNTAPSKNENKQDIEGFGVYAEEPYEMS